MLMEKMQASIGAPERQEQVLERQAPPWMVTVYNNDTNTYEEVIVVLVLGTGCTTEEAYIEAWEIDHFGQCVVHRADEGECRAAAEVIATIGIKVEVSPAD